MNGQDFISLDEIDALPDDDPQAAFSQFVRIAQTNLRNGLSGLKEDDQYDWALIQDARYGFMNAVTAAAKRFEIQPLASIEMPRIDKFESREYRQFQFDLDHYIMQLMLENSSRSKRDSVFVSAELKSSIRTYIHHLRELIEKADLPDQRRAALLKKLDDFDAELERKRLSLMTVTMVVLALASGPGGVWSTGEAAQKLVSKIWNAVGEAKVADDAARLRLEPGEAPKAITGPRSGEFGPNKVGPRSDLNDDIPF